MSGMFYFWLAARTADQLAHDAAPYHALGEALARGEQRLPAAQLANVQRLKGLVASYHLYQDGHLTHHEYAAQCVAACVAYWQGRNARPRRWRKVRNHVLRFELGLPSLRSSHVRALGEELCNFLQQ